MVPYGRLLWRGSLTLNTRHLFPVLSPRDGGGRICLRGVFLCLCTFVNKRDVNWLGQLPALFCTCLQSCFAVLCDSSTLFISVQFCLILVSMHSEKPICAPTRLLEVLPHVAFETVPRSVWLALPLSRSFKARDRRALPLSEASLLRAIDGVVSLALCPQASLKVISTSDTPRRKPQS